MKDRSAAVQERCRAEDVQAFLCMSIPNARYLSGFTGTNCALLITTDDAFFITDFRYREQSAEEVSGFQYRETTTNYLKTAMDVISEEKITSLAFESQHLVFRDHQRLVEHHPGVTLHPAEGWIEELREVKDEEELALITEAVRIADEVFDGVRSWLQVGMTEDQVANEIERLLREKGASKASFDVIVASGKRSALPHGTHTSKKITAGEPIVIDFGADCKGYNSDLTRTIVLDTIVGEQVAAIHDLVVRAQDEAISQVRPGIDARTLDEVARSIIRDGGYGDHFGHGLGHGVGLEVHESPTVSKQGDRPIRPGMVFTVEPGIYLPEIGGVRVESIVHVTEDGCEVLTESPRSMTI